MFLWFWPQPEGGSCSLPTLWSQIPFRAGWRGSPAHRLSGPQSTNHGLEPLRNRDCLWAVLFSMIVLKIRVILLQFSHPHCCTSSCAGIQRCQHTMFFFLCSFKFSFLAHKYKQM